MRRAGHLIEGERALRAAAAACRTFFQLYRTSGSASAADESWRSAAVVSGMASTTRRSAHHESLSLGLDFHNAQPTVRTLLCAQRPTPYDNLAPQSGGRVPQDVSSNAQQHTAGSAAW